MRPLSNEDNNNLINFIATTVEAMREQMASKDDIVRLESRMEAMRAEMATDLFSLEHRLREEMATKDDLAQLEHRLREEMATKDDLALLATVVRGDFEQVHFRFDTLERVMSAIRAGRNRHQSDTQRALLVSQR